jgi:hypothetical protein
MRQLDDGIGDTLVLALKVLGDAIPSNVNSTSVLPTLLSLQALTIPDRRPVAIWKQTRAHFIPRDPIQRCRRYHRPIDSPQHLGCNRRIAGG